MKENNLTNIIIESDEPEFENPYELSEDEIVILRDELDHNIYIKMNI